LATSDPTTGSITTPSGWGKSSDAALSITDILRKVDVPTITNQACDNVYGIVGDGMICVATAGGKGTCNVSFILINFTILKRA
jgi:hypothetical protein